ncbi:hypothetical protein DOTSEDRAFT_75218 [Dothistroma septosporum NZE10]|uniref:Uncharacterized protein n=1 Tax=Dothistroma septosporum (strain NZE10 / CBS 128990) TaxID=675120 RepID=M2WKH1_DOTSN|nr:hypothetical protein DOTSEDRAFT_75218 [Dothistroma septosporum NZE10]
MEIFKERVPGRPGVKDRVKPAVISTPNSWNTVVASNPRPAHDAPQARQPPAGIPGISVKSSTAPAGVPGTSVKLTTAPASTEVVQVVNKRVLSYAPSATKAIGPIQRSDGGTAQQQYIEFKGTEAELTGSAYAIDLWNFLDSMWVRGKEKTLREMLDEYDPKCHASWVKWWMEQVGNNALCFRCAYLKLPCAHTIPCGPCIENKQAKFCQYARCTKKNRGTPVDCDEAKCKAFHQIHRDMIADWVTKKGQPGEDLIARLFSVNETPSRQWVAKHGTITSNAITKLWLKDPAAPCHLDLTALPPVGSGLPYSTDNPHSFDVQYQSFFWCGRPLWVWATEGQLDVALSYAKSRSDEESKKTGQQVVLPNNPFVWLSEDNGEGDAGEEEEEKEEEEDVENAKDGEAPSKDGVAKGEKSS